ncbi:MAG: hypothetical protein IJQ81_18555 [Oscillibacter sp.]|nr:hypothetical protein [Oscillibacter sp.]
MRRSEVIFRRGDILSREMLEELYRYPREVAESFFSSYTDGILYGLSWRGDGGYIQPGALKFQGRIYYLTNPLDAAERLKDRVRDGEKYRLVFRPEYDSERAAKDGGENPLRVYSLTLDAFHTERFERERTRIFYYMYAQYGKRDGFIPLDDPHEVYGLCAANDGYAFAFSPDFVRRKLLPEIEDKARKHPMDFPLMQTAFQDERLSVRFIRQYLKEYRLQTGRSGEISDELLSDSGKLLDELMTAIKYLRFAGSFADPESAPSLRKDAAPKREGRML